MQKRILITDKVHPLLIDGLKVMGYEIDYDTTVDMSILPSIIHQYEGMVINSKIRMYKDTIDLAKNLKFIARLGSGMEIIDVPYALSKGITPINSPEGNRNAVAEHAIGMILALYNNLFVANLQTKNFEWNREENRGFELRGKTIGIIGLGNTGESVARKLSSWQLKILSYDKYRTNYPSDLDFVQKVNLEDILSQADVISLHLPLTEETRHMINLPFLQKCKNKPLIVNTSRGEVVKTEDLIVALEKQIIFGACLDVFENEKVNTYSAGEYDMYKKLFQYKNVIASPHIAGWTKESLEGIASVLLEKIKKAVC
jgi:D-3-phosphoglycerate dehydrogenase / 2-oxoglutarate reductase